TTNNADILRLNIRVAPMTIAGGPRVISSTMGPVKAVTVDGATFNGTTNPDGTPRLDGFAVTFDRLVDIRSLAGQVQAFYHSPTTPSDQPGTPVAIGTIQALDPQGPIVPGQGQVEATTFLVHFLTAQSATGTYSYAVGPGIHDLNRTALVLPGN